MYSPMPTPADLQHNSTSRGQELGAAGAPIPSQARGTSQQPHLKPGWGLIPCLGPPGWPAALLQHSVVPHRTPPDPNASQPSLHMLFVLPHTHTRPHCKPSLSAVYSLLVKICSTLFTIQSYFFGLISTSKHEILYVTMHLYTFHLFSPISSSSYHNCSFFFLRNTPKMFKTQAKQESFILKMVKTLTSFPVQHIQRIGKFHMLLLHINI